jgi:hydroxymethylpyrimidine pyrophosphatase-like HAD family hydrolase
MDLPIKLVSTDFDGTIFTEFEQPPVALPFEHLMTALQARGMVWVINTGRDMSSLMESLGRARLSIRPDYLVLVEREIYRREGARYVPLDEWNEACQRDHAELFSHVREDVPSLVQWVNQRFPATVYEDAYSPFCLIAEDNHDADQIHEYLIRYCEGVPNLSVVRNDVYARFSHSAYNKGTALAHIAGRLGLTADHVFAAGDHFNDLPMLRRDVARWLAAPVNAIEVVRDWVRSQQGYLSHHPCGTGVARGLELALEEAGFPLQRLNMKS